MSAEQVTELRLSMPQPWDITAINPDTSHGLVIVGMAQAGKTTLTRLAAKAWQEFDHEAHVLNFSNSDGFRGFAAIAISYAGLDFEQPVNADEFNEQLDDFIASLSIAEVDDLFDELYAAPLRDDILRNPAVNSAVGIVAAHEHLRPVAERSGSDRLKTIVENPNLIRLDRVPSLVLLDSRNQTESLEKFEHAGVRSLGTIVLTCDEEIVVSRNSKAGTVDDLRKRNQTDRGRQLGPMTLPEDLSLPFNLTDIHSKHETLYAAGILLASIADSGLHIDTAVITEQQEAAALPPLMSGMLAAA